jgi:hypothetical protein
MSDELSSVVDSKWERETVILMSDGDKNVILDTFQRSVISKLAKAEIKPISIDEKSGRHNYVFSVKQLSFRKLSSGNKAPMSQERKDANAAHLAAGREAKKNNAKSI